MVWCSASEAYLTGCKFAFPTSHPAVLQFPAFFVLCVLIFGWAGDSGMAVHRTRAMISRGICAINLVFGTGQELALVLWIWETVFLFGSANEGLRKCRKVLRPVLGGSKSVEFLLLVGSLVFVPEIPV